MSAAYRVSVQKWTIEGAVREWVSMTWQEENDKKQMWLLEASGEGQRDSLIVIGGIEEIKRGMADMMFFGTYEEANKDEMVRSYLDEIGDVENYWTHNGEVWETESNAGFELARLMTAVKC